MSAPQETLPAATGAPEAAPITPAPAPPTAVERLRERQERAEKARAASAEQHAARALEILDLLEAYVAEFGAATVPALPKDKDGNPDPRDPSFVFAQRLADHPLEDVTRGFAELKRAAQKFGRKVALVPTGAGMFVIRFPGEAHYKRFFNLFYKENHKAEASEQLAVAACVSPSGTEAADILRKNAALCYPLADRAVDLGGVAVDPK